jgi:transcriptional regulator with XRE-family HTH domain
MSSKMINKKEDILKQFERLLAFKDGSEKLEFEASKIHLDFIEELSKMMEEQSMSKSELAEKIGTSKSYITQLFSGDKMVNLVFIAKIQRIFNVKFNILQTKAPVYAKEFRDGIRKQGYQVYGYAINCEKIVECLNRAS